MPRPKDGFKILTIHVPADLADAMEALADALGRSVTAEVVHACRRHLAQPPKLVDAEVLVPADVEKGPPQPKRKPGRPTKAPPGPV